MNASSRHCPVPTTLLLLACLLLGVAHPLHANDIKYPKSKPLLSMTIPDDWSVQTKDGTLYAVAPGGGVLVVLSVDLGTEAGGATGTVKDFAEGAKMEAVEIKDLGEVEDPDAKGNQALAVGKKDGKDYVALLLKLTLPKGSKVGVVFYGPRDKVFDDALVKPIADSIKVIK